MPAVRDRKLQLRNTRVFLKKYRLLVATVAVALLLLLLPLGCYLLLESTKPPSYTIEDTKRYLGARPDDDALACARRNLQLDASGAPLHRATDMRGAIPLLVTPVSSPVDAALLPQLLCMLAVPVRYHVLVLNSRSAEAHALVDRLEAALSPSGRFVVRRNGLNAGYAGSMNQGLRWGMETRTGAEVPWTALANADVWLAPETQRRMVELADAQAQLDAPLLAALQAEVEQEQRWAAEGNLTYYHTYVPPGRPLVVLREGAPGVPSTVRTSRLLPDRLRYTHERRNGIGAFYSAEERRAMPFAGRAGLIFPCRGGSFFPIHTRLLTSTVGYFDDGFYPAYSEDVDLEWRAAALGFEVRPAAACEPSRVRHAVSVNLRVGASGGPGSPPAEDARWYRRIFDLRDPYSVYSVLKMGRYTTGSALYQRPARSSYDYVFFNAPRFPVDLCVDDPSFFQCFRDGTRGGPAAWGGPTGRCRYNLAALLDSGALTAEQAAAVRRVARECRCPPPPSWWWSRLFSRDGAEEKPACVCDGPQS